MHDAVGAREQRVVETRIERTVPRQRTTHANNCHDECSCPKNKNGDLAASAREERLNPFATEVVAKWHDYFSFGASAKR
jgi:hypothetical protein